MLQDDYENIFSHHKKDWKYYDELELKYPFASHDNALARLFILDYLQYSGKFELYEDVLIDNMRAQHTVSVFFLGISLLHSLQGYYGYNINGFVDKYKTKENIKNEFSFYWFLTCLYHDIGYHFEEVPNPGIPDLLSLKKSVKYKPRIIADKFIPKKLLASIKNYYNHHHNNDHGIIGGYMLYDRIMKLFKKTDSDGRIEGVNGLVLDNSFKPVFATVARTIAVHNIYYCFKEIASREEIAGYMNHKIPSLIIDAKDQPPINFRDHPLLYTLCLADTIDPVKIIMKYARNQGHVNEEDVINILNHVDIEFNAKKQITLSTDDPFYKQALLSKFRLETVDATDGQKANLYWLGVDIIVKD